MRGKVWGRIFLLALLLFAGIFFARNLNFLSKENTSEIVVSPSLELEPGVSSLASSASQEQAPAGNVRKDENVTSSRNTIHTTGKIQGSVSDPEGIPLQNVKIDIWPSSRENTDLFSLSKKQRLSPLASCLSNELGAFELPATEGEIYFLVAFKEGYSRDWNGEYACCSEPLKLVLRLGNFVLGRILNPRNEPLANAYVKIEKDREVIRREGGNHLDFVITEEDGTFRLGPIPTSSTLWWLETTHDDWAGVTVKVPSVESGPYDLGDIILGPQGTLLGRVVDLDSKPLQGVEVIPFDRNDAFPVSFSPPVITDKDGRFEVHHAKLHSYYIFQLTKQGYFQVNDPKAGVLPDSGECLLMMAREGLLKGVVHFPSGFQSQSPTLVSLLMLSLSGKSSLTNELELPQGETNFAFDGVATGVYEVQISHPQLTPSQLSDVHVQSGKTIEVEVQLLAGRNVRGRVIDGKTGNPITDALVRQIKLSPSGKMDSVLPNSCKTDADGIFSLPGVVTQSSMMSVKKEQYAVFFLPIPSSDTDTDLGVIRLVGGGHFRLMLRSLSEPMTPEGVFAGLTSEEIGFYRPLELDSQGYFSTRDLPPGKYQLAVRDWFYERSTLRSAEMNRAVQIVGGETTEMQIDYRSGGTVFGTVMRGKDPFTSARDWGYVSILRKGEEGQALASGNCDWSGRYELFGIPAGKYVVQFQSLAGSLPVTLRQDLVFNEGDRREVNFELSETGLSGKIKAWNAEQGLIGAKIDIFSVEASSPVAALMSGGAGNFSIASLNPGRYFLVVQKEGFGEESLGPVLVEDKQILFAGEVTLAPEAMVSVSVKDSVARPVPGAMLKLEKAEWDGRGARHTITKSSESSLFKGLGNGSYKLSVKAANFPDIERVVSTQSGETRQLDLALKSVGNLKITVLDAQGQSLSGIPIHVEALPERTSVAAWVDAGFVQVVPLDWKTNSDGVCLVQALPVGEFAIHASFLGDVVSTQLLVNGKESEAITLVAP